MACNTAHTHEFAPDLSPAWLKLPTIVTKKTSNDSYAEDTQNSQQTRRHTTPKSDFDKLRTTDANTNDNCSQRINTNHDSSLYLNSRHNSFADDDQYHNFNGHSNASHVIANRFNKSKHNDATQRPNLRHDYRDKTVYNHSKHQNRSYNEYKNAKKTLNDKSAQYEEMGKKANSNEANCNVFNQEFPSLIDDTITNNCSQSSSNPNLNSAWNNSAAKSKVLSTSSKNKVQLVQRSVANFDNNDVNSKSEMNAIISNNMKQTITPPVYRNMSIIGKTKGVLIKENGNYANIGAKMMPIIGKTNSQMSSPAMEILVKNPKLRANKSDFLKSIRTNESNNCDSFERNNTNKENGIDSESEHENNKSNYSSETEAKRHDNDVNAVNNCCDNSFKGGVLSSSLEAEHRFLMELGWKQDDDPSYAPLTEDEVNEFKDLVNTRNGFKRYNNSLNQALHLNLSSKKTPPLPFFSIRNEMLPNSDDESSSSSSNEDN